MDNIIISCQSSQQKIAGINDVHVKIVDGQTQVVEYKPSKNKTLYIDFGSPEMKQYVGNAMGYASQQTPPPDPAAPNSLSEWGQCYVYRLNEYVGRTPLPDPDMMQRWEQEWSKTKPDEVVIRELGKLMHTTQAAQCRERSIMLHILLAQFGIPSRVIHVPGHAWVVCDDSKGVLVLGLDPARRMILRKAANEDPLQNMNPAECTWFIVVRPRLCQRFFSNPGFDWKAVPLPAVKFQ